MSDLQTWYRCQDNTGWAMRADAQRHADRLGAPRPNVSEVRVLHPPPEGTDGLRRFATPVKRKGGNWGSGKGARRRQRKLPTP